MGLRVRAVDKLTGLGKTGRMTGIYRSRKVRMHSISLSHANMMDENAHEKAMRHREGEITGQGHEKEAEGARSSLTELH